MIIAVEGIDGSGKSSLIKKISETYENVYTFSISDFVKHYHNHGEDLFRGTSYKPFKDIFRIADSIAAKLFNFSLIGNAEYDRSSAVLTLHDEMLRYGKYGLIKCFDGLKDDSRDKSVVYNDIAKNYAHLMYMLSYNYLNIIQRGPSFKNLQKFIGTYKEPIIILDRWYCSTIAYNASIEHTLVSNMYKEKEGFSLDTEHSNFDGFIFTNKLLNERRCVFGDDPFLLFTRCVVPDYVIYLDADVDTALSRINKRGNTDVFESKEKLKRVRKAYLDLVESYELDNKHPYVLPKSKRKAKANGWVADFKVAKNPVISIDTNVYNEDEVFMHCENILNIILGIHKPLKFITIQKD